jgi:signal transduction histidine kinase
MVLTTVAALVVVTGQWSAERAEIVEQAELLAIDEADAAADVRGDVFLLPVADHQFAIAIADDEIVAVEGNVPDEAGPIAVENAIETGVAEGTVSVDEFDVGGDRWATAATECFDPEVCHVIAVGVRAPSWIEAVSARLIVAAGAIAFATTVSALAAAWLASRALRPVEAMREELEETTANDLARRVPVAETGDELEQLGRTLNDTLDRLESAVLANKQFAADAAHELRSPLTGIRAAVELRATATGDDLLEDVLTEIDRASALVDDLLLLARGERAGVETEPVDVTELVGSELRDAQLRHPDLTLGFDGSSAPVMAVKPGLRRVVRNLIENACSYGRDTVSVTIGSDASQMTLFVDDDGPGIPLDDRARVFERFVRLDESRARSSGGTGLGLAIVAEFVSANGGTVSIVDSPLGGARFAVTVPLAGGESRRSPDA